MRKTFKIFGVLALIASTGYVLYKAYKQEFKKLEKEEKKEKAELEELGISKEKVEEEMVPGDNNLVKAMYTGIRFSSYWDLDYINTKGCLNSQNVIHVGISDTPYGKQGLAFMFEIPATTEGNYRAPRIGDYISSFSAAAKHLWYDVVKVADPEDENSKPITKLEGYLSVSYKKDGDDEEYLKLVKIPQELYSMYRTKDHDGLTEYVEAVRSRRVKFNNLDCKLMDLMDMVDDDGKYIFEAKAKDVLLFFKIVFPIQLKTENGVTRGINLKSGIQSLEYLIDSVEVIGKNGRVTYDHVLFHPQNEKNNNWVYFQYYDTEKDKETGEEKVLIFEFDYKD